MPDRPFRDFAVRDDCPWPHNGQEWSVARLSGSPVTLGALWIRCPKCFPLTAAEIEGAQVLARRAQRMEALAKAAVSS